MDKFNENNEHSIDHHLYHFVFILFFTKMNNKNKLVSNDVQSISNFFCGTLFTNLFFILSDQIINLTKVSDELMICRFIM